MDENYKSNILIPINNKRPANTEFNKKNKRLAGINNALLLPVENDELLAGMDNIVPVENNELVPVENDELLAGMDNIEPVENNELVAVENDELLAGMDNIVPVENNEPVAIENDEPIAIENNEIEILDHKVPENLPTIKNRTIYDFYSMAALIEYVKINKITKADKIPAYYKTFEINALFNNLCKTKTSLEMVGGNTELYELIQKNIINQPFNLTGKREELLNHIEQTGEAPATDNKYYGIFKSIVIQNFDFSELKYSPRTINIIKNNKPGTKHYTTIINLCFYIKKYGKMPTQRYQKYNNQMIGYWIEEFKKHRNVLIKDPFFARFL